MASSSPASSPLTSHTDRESDNDNVKRRKLDLMGDRTPLDGLPNRPSSSSSLSTPPSSRAAARIPPVPFLYYLATSSHHTSQQHLQQAFIPPNVVCRSAADCAPIMAKTPDGTHSTFTPDPQATAKSLSLLLLSLDLLRLGLASKELSDRERVAFGHQFVIVAVKVIQTASCPFPGKGKEMALVNLSRIWNDVNDIAGHSLAVARRHSFLKVMGDQMEILSARLAFMQNKANTGRRVLRQALSSSADVAHQLTLLLISLEFCCPSSPGEAFSLVEDLESRARAHGQTSVIQLAYLIRLRLLLQHRQWDGLPSALSNLAGVLGMADPAADSAPDRYSLWIVHLELHYVQLRALWEGRAGNDSLAKSFIKQAYALMDRVADSGALRQLRQSGGQLELPLQGLSIPFILLQVTPPNVTYIMIYLSTVTSRRDFLGAANACKNLVLPKIMREYENVARAEDIWDINFTSSHGPADALSLRHEILLIRLEIMLEEATALIYRSEYRKASEVLHQLMRLAQHNDVFGSLAPHICLVQAQLAHLLGQDQVALKWYRACSSLLKPGSELGLLVDINKYACEGLLENLGEDPSRASHVRQVAEKCRASSNSGLVAAGYFLGSLAEPNRVASKKRLSTAHEISQRANNNVLRCLIFAFTTSVHLYGPVDRTLRQLETGRDLAKLMGGKDREDGVGQLALGLWFAAKLREYHRREGDVAQHAAAKELQHLHLKRLEAQKAEVNTVFR